LAFGSGPVEVEFVESGASIQLFRLVAGDWDFTLFAAGAIVNVAIPHPKIARDILRAGADVICGVKALAAGYTSTPSSVRERRNRAGDAGEMAIVDDQSRR